MKIGQTSKEGKEHNKQEKMFIKSSGGSSRKNSTLRGLKSVTRGVIKCFVIVLSFIILLLKSLNPDSYRMLKEKELKKAFSFFFTLIIILLLALFITFIPSINSLPTMINQSLSRFETFTVQPVINGNEEIRFDYGGTSIVYSPTERNLSDEVILFTNTKIKYEKPCFSIIPTYCYFRNLKGENIIVKDYSEFFNLKENKDLIKGIKTIILMLIPVLFILGFLYVSAYALIIILLITIAFKIILMIAKKKAGFSELLKIGLYSSTTLLIGLFLGWYYHNNIIQFLGFIVYVTFYLLGVLLNYFQIDV